MKYRLTLKTFSAAVMMASVASTQAAISLLDSGGFTSTTGSVAGTHTVTAANLSGFDASGASKLIVTTAGEGTNNDVTQLTYGGVDMIEIVDNNSGGRENSIWYLNNVSVTGDFVVTYSGGAGSQSGIGLGAYALGGFVGGVVEVSQTSANSGTTTYYDQIELTADEAGEFVVASFVRNNFDNSHDGSGGRDAGTEVVAPLIQQYYGSTNSSSAGGGYQFTSGPGTLTPSIFDHTNGTGSVIAVRFEVIPEPSSTALLGLGGLALILRRRR